MIAAFVGLFGVLVGVFLSQVFTIAHESRTRRLDALAALVAASGRMIGAYERLFELFEGGTSPPLNEDRVVAVTSERLSAHTEWREAQARAEILLADDRDLHAVVSDFEIVRATATAWARAYFQAGEAFDFSGHDEAQRKAWDGMKAERRRLIAVAQRRAGRDAHRMLPPRRVPQRP